MDTESSNVVTDLLSVASLVFILEKENGQFSAVIFLMKNIFSDFGIEILTSLTMSLEVLAASTETASLGR